MNKYEVLGTVGEGVYGTVFRCRNRQTGEVVAVKKFKESEDVDSVRKTSLREVKMLRTLRDHAGIVTLLEAFRRKGRLYLVFEYVGRNLLEELEQHPRGLAPELVRRYTYMLSRALHSCHSERIIHRDIKPENLLINGRERTLKLCDFGFARMTGSAGSAGGSSSGPYTDYVATRWYRSPELLLGTTRYDGKVDLWAIGCILSEMADGQALFPGESEVDQLHLIQRTMGNLSPAQVSAFNANPRFSAYTLPKVTHLQTLEKRHSGRLIRKCINLMKGLLHTCPEKRLTSLEAMRHPWFEGLHDPQNEIAPKSLPSDEPSPATAATPTPAPAPAAAATAPPTAAAKADARSVATTPPPPPSPPPPQPQQQPQTQQPQPQPQPQTQAQPSCTTRTTTTTTTTTTTVVFGPGTSLPTRSLPKPSLCGLLADRHGLTQRSTPAGGPDTTGSKATCLARPLADVNPLWRQSKRLPLARPSHSRGGAGAETLGNEWAPGSDLVRAGFNDRACSLHFALSHGDRVPEGGGHPVPLHTAFAAARKTGKQLPRLSSAESRSNGGLLGAGKTPCPATIPVLSSARQSRQQSAGKPSRSRSGSKTRSSSVTPKQRATDSDGFDAVDPLLPSGCSVTMADITTKPFSGKALSLMNRTHQDSGDGCGRLGGLK